MTKNRLRLFLSRAAIVVVIALLLGAVTILMSYVQSLLSSDTKINLTEIVTQNKDVITSRLNARMSELEAATDQISDRIAKQDPSADRVVAAFLEYHLDHGSSNIFVASPSGIATFSDGKTLDISGRKYFQLAIGGTQNISERVISRVSGEEVFIISVPIEYQGEIVGTLQREYTAEEMYKICEPSLFSSQGSMSIINDEGYIIIDSQGQTYSQENENYFRNLYAGGDQEAAEQIERDVLSESDGFIETSHSGEQFFSVYTPLEGIHDWNLITSISTKAVSPNAKIVINLFYVILILVIFTFGIGILFFRSYKKRQQKRLEKIAFVDPVTGGDTFARFAIDLSNTLVNHPSGTFWLLSFDIDNFKYINSYYGFDFGDRILSTIYNTIAAQLLPQEALARVSDDRFITLIVNPDKTRLDAMLASIQDQGDVTIYISAGIYEIKDPTENVNLMADKASAAARSSKNSLHKEIVEYSDEYSRRLTHNEQLKRAVEQALVNDEFLAFYQPKINVETGVLVGAEALARWRKSDGTLVSPAEFIPLCEKTGLIVDLDMVILKKVLRFLKAKLDAGIPCVPISVNFSRLHLVDPNFLDTIVMELDTYGIPHNLIELELTESIMFDSHDAIVTFVTEVHKRGLLVSMLFIAQYAERYSYRCS
ncbi:MAG: EAL domain-containing protein [Raoultibacter sp.]